MRISWRKGADRNKSVERILTFQEGYSMTKTELKELLSGILDAETVKLDSPSEDDWQALEARFKTTFPAEFKIFIELMSEFSFPGDIYNVTDFARGNGNDSIWVVYENEILHSNWPESLVPFYGIGNGDYFALNAREGKDSAVYYRCHESGRIEKYCFSFEDWLNKLPAFLKGKS